MVSHEISCFFKGQETYLIELCPKESAIREKMVWEKVAHCLEKRIHSIKLL